MLGAGKKRAASFSRGLMHLPHMVVLTWGKLSAWVSVGKNFYTHFMHAELTMAHL